MLENTKNGAKIVSVAFPPQGGNSWSIVSDSGAFFNHDIPEECHNQMLELSKDRKIIWVAFPPQGSNSWSIVDENGGCFNHNIDEEADMIMGFLSEVYGPIKIVAFDPAGVSWSVTCAVNKAEKVCNDTHCVAIADVFSNIRDRLDGKVVGYACTVGSSGMGAFSHGHARTSANIPVRLFLPSTKITVASVSKVITTLAAIRVLAKNNVKLEDGIGKYVPSDWKLYPCVSSITFRQLLSHRSGIKDYGNNSQNYDVLKAFFTQEVDPTKETKCQPAGKVPMDPINPNDKRPCYSNYNFSIFRVLLPIVDGFADNPADRAAKLATAYIRLVQTHVFELVGAVGVDAKPPTTELQAFSYKFPGSASGYDWGDLTPNVGAAGWYLTIEDIAKVLCSLNKNDERILTKDQLNDMVSYPLGWDTKTDRNGYRYIEKRGGYGMNGTTITTSIALIGPGVFAALFVNSDIHSPGFQNNWQWCNKCEALTFTGNVGLGECPAGGLHDDNSSGSYKLRVGGIVDPGSQSKWGWCSKCQALAFTGGASLGICSEGGLHDHSGSRDYIFAMRGNGGLPKDTQDNWHWCNKCQVLVFAGDASLGSCAAGGRHDHTGSGNYMLRYVVTADRVLYEAYMEALKPNELEGNVLSEKKVKF